MNKLPEPNGPPRRAAHISRRRFVQATSVLAMTALSSNVFAAGGIDRRKVDVCIYSATSGGVIAAVTLARLGHSVLLIEPTRHVGGMTTGGLGWIDFGRASAIGGLTKKYFEDVRAYYAGAGVKGNGWSVEPHVAEMLFEKMLAEQHVEVVREARLVSTQKDGRLIRSITLDKAPVDSHGAPAAVASEKNFMSVEATMFMDCSYEGDLLAGAGVSHRTDREGRDEYGESLAGICYDPPRSEQLVPDGDSKNKKKTVTTVLKLDPYIRPGDPASGLIPLVSSATPSPIGSRSAVIQAYNFRACLTKTDPIPIAAPDDYDPKRYELFARYISALAAAGQPLWPGDLYFNFGHEKRYSAPRLLKITHLMRGKTDVNNEGFISTDFVTGGAEHYAQLDWAGRAKIWRAHEAYQRGLFYYLRTEERLPGWLREEMALWGLPKDEFTDSGGWPTQLYVREARRMLGRYVIDQKHCEKPSVREDSIGLGSYSLDSHVCQRLVKAGAIIHEGGFLRHDVNQPYPIPYAAITPRAEECENLLVTFCISSTHVAFASVRMEPPFMIMSESAAFAIDEAMKAGASVQDVSPDKLRSRLLAAGQVL